MIKQEQLSLYYSAYCPFCHIVLDALVELGIMPDLKKNKAGKITLKNTATDQAARKELQRGGGKTTVPCLRIERGGSVEWMYESMDIVKFLKANLK